MTPQTRRLIVPVIAAGLPLTFAVPAQGQEIGDQERQQQLEARMVNQMLDVAFRAGEHIIETYYLVLCFEEALAQV